MRTLPTEIDGLSHAEIAEKLGMHAAVHTYIKTIEAERDQLLARIEDTDSACADYAFAGAHTAREIIEKLHDRIRGYKTDRDLLAEANDQLRAKNARLITTLKLIADNYDASDRQIALVEAAISADDAPREGGE